MKLLSEPSANHKTKKLMDQYGIAAFTLQLLPRRMAFEDQIANNLGIKDFCPKATDHCFKTCIALSGRASWVPVDSEKNKIIIARKKRSQLLIEDPCGFSKKLDKEIASAIRRFGRKGYTVVFRLNCFSDILWERLRYLDGQSIIEKWENQIFYDYTKIINRSVPDNYRITFSRSGENDKECLVALEKGWNVAVVFRDTVPEAYWGIKVIDGDVHDYRFLDNEEHGQSPLIVGLRFKGKIPNHSSFVV